jgi:hypothetical protein
LTNVATLVNVRCPTSRRAGLLAHEQAPPVGGDDASVDHAAPLAPGISECLFFLANLLKRKNDLPDAFIQA